MAEICWRVFHSRTKCSDLKRPILLNEGYLISYCRAYNRPCLPQDPDKPLQWCIIVDVWVRHGKISEVQGTQGVMKKVGRGKGYIFLSYCAQNCSLNHSLQILDTYQHWMRQLIIIAVQNGITPVASEFLSSIASHCSVRYIGMKWVWTIWFLGWTDESMEYALIHKRKPISLLYDDTETLIRVYLTEPVVFQMMAIKPSLVNLWFIYVWFIYAQDSLCKVPSSCSQLIMTPARGFHDKWKAEVACHCFPLQIPPWCSDPASKIWQVGAITWFHSSQDSL